MKINGYDVEDGIVKAVFITDLKRDLKMARFEKERPHGEWVLDQEFSFVFNIYECSKCRFDGSKRWHFCPNCGASMSKKEGEAE